MPRATVDTTSTKRFELKTLPEGYVELVKMTYGQKLDRMALVTKMTVKAERGRGKGRGQRNRDFEGQMEMAQMEVAALEFRTCIVGHNLEDETGRLLNFSIVGDIKRLDPKIGDEIGTYIDELNQFNADDDEDDEEGNS